LPSSFANNIAVVYGGNNAANSDFTAAESIRTGFNLRGGSDAISGDTFLIGANRNLLNIGDDLSIAGTVTQSRWDYLSSGDYQDNSGRDYTFEQRVDFGDQATVGLISNRNLNNNEPTLGIQYNNRDNVLNYTLRFNRAINANASVLVDTELPLFGGSYYVQRFDSGSNALVLLDSRNTLRIAEQGTKTITVDGRTYEIYVDYINGRDEVFLVVNGEDFSLRNGGTRTLSDGTRLTVNNILAFEAGIQGMQVRLSIGGGEITMPLDGSTMQLAGDDLSGLTSSFDNRTFTISWRADERVFLADGNGA